MSGVGGAGGALGGVVTVGGVLAGGKPEPECRGAPVKLERAPLAKAEAPPAVSAPHKPAAAQASPVRRKVLQ